jgi:hypothetical protein
MRLALVSAVAFGVSLSLAGGASAAPAQSRDGTWSVRMVTEAGSCDSSYSYSVAVTNGQVRHLQAAGEAPTTINGQIGADGGVNLDIRRSIAQASANGRLSDKSGSGTWRLSMLGCQGRWTAMKRSQTASN